MYVGLVRPLVGQLVRLDDPSSARVDQRSRIQIHGASGVGYGTSGTSMEVPVVGTQKLSGHQKKRKRKEDEKSEQYLGPRRRGLKITNSIRFAMTKRSLTL